MDRRSLLGKIGITAGALGMAERMQGRVSPAPRPFAPTETRRWICPELCGCEIDITAQWTDDPSEISYRHPVPFTITRMHVACVCAGHGRLQVAPIPNELFQDYSEDGELKPQVRGYVRVPIQDPTPAERLYVNLWRYSGQVMHKLTCDCKVYAAFDRTLKDEAPRIMEHPEHTVKCSRHRHLSSEEIWRG